jgi:hypothetical protein
MSYIINQTNGNVLINITDGTADGPDINPGLNSSDINLFGHNYPNYGLYQNENFIKLLQNFANSAPPSQPLVGEIWYDTSTGLVKVFNGTTFIPVSPVILSATQPSTTLVGAQWWDTTNDQLKSYNGSAWITIGPLYSKTQGKSGAVTETIYDTVGGSHNVVKLYNGGAVTAVVSADPLFAPNVAISGIPLVGPGITLPNNNNAEFNGTASDSHMLGSVLAANYARTDVSTTFSANIQVGGTNGLSIKTNPSIGWSGITNSSFNGNIDVYNNVNGINTRTLHIDGSTGLVSVGFNPVNALGVATKGYVDTAISLGTAPLATLGSPALTGTPTAPNPGSAGSSQIATTAYTQNAIATSTSALWLGSGKTVSSGTPGPFDGNPGDFWFQI